MDKLLSPFPGMVDRDRAETTDEPTLDGAFAPDGVDLTVLRWMLERSPTERLLAVQDLIDTAWILRGGSQT